MNNLKLYVLNVKDIYRMYAYLAGQCERKAKKGVVLSVNRLAESSSMKKIVYAAAHYAAQYEERYTASEKREARYELAKEIIDEVSI